MLALNRRTIINSGFGLRGCVHLGRRLHASEICPMPCAYPMPKSPLHASIKKMDAFLVAKISVPKDSRVHSFQK